jgi:hypothetical protein
MISLLLTVFIVFIITTVYCVFSVFIICTRCEEFDERQSRQTVFEWCWSPSDDLSFPWYVLPVLWTIRMIFTTGVKINNINNIVGK